MTQCDHYPGQIECDWCRVPQVDRFSGHLASCGIRTRHDFACSCGGPWPATAGFRGNEEEETHDDECTQGDGEPGNEWHSRRCRSLRGEYRAPCDACGRPTVTDPDQIICDKCYATDPTRDPVNFPENIR